MTLSSKVERVRKGGKEQGTCGLSLEDCNAMDTLTVTFTVGSSWISIIEPGMTPVRVQPVRIAHSRVTAHAQHSARTADRRNLRNRLYYY